MSKQHTFIVEGRGEFPLDMLRRDEAFPRDTESAHAIATPDSPKAAPRRVRLGTHGFGPNLDRWLSFGWTVIAWVEWTGDRDRVHIDFPND
jgi:hypothetical protein